MADNIKYRFIQNVGDYFPSGYFSDDFLEKVQKCAGLSAEEMKSLNASFVSLQKHYDDYKNFIVNLHPRTEDAIKHTHDFNTRLLRLLGYDPGHPYSEWLVVKDDCEPAEVIPVRHILRRGGRTKMLVMEMQHLVRVDEQEPAGLFEQQYESEPDRTAPHQRYHAGQWRFVFGLDRAKYKISPSVINKAVTHIFLLPEERRPHFVLMLAGNVVFLFDKDKWAKGAYLEFSLDELFAQARIPAFRNYYALFHMLCCKETLAADSEMVLMDTIIEESYKNAYEVTKDLREGVILAVETLANEALYWWKQHGTLPVRDYTNDLFEEEVKDDCLTIVYRLLFLFYAESRGELEILPVSDEVYRRGYSLEALRDLETVRLNSEESRNGYFFDESVRHLFALLSGGHNEDSAAADSKSFRVRPIDSPLFDDRQLRHLAPVRIRNAKWQEIVRALSLSKKKNYCGRISYANLGVNQLGSVYESLLAFRGFYAEEDYIEVHKAGKPEEGTYLVPYSRMADFELSEVLCDADTGEPRIVPEGTFVYRLNGRDRQKSASYYTPEALTRSTVKYTLKAIVDEVAAGERPATDLLELKILEPAMGAAAFQNEVINQVAEAYLTLQQQQLRAKGRQKWRIAPDRYRDELQKVKAYIATHNVYGVDLNPTAIELGKLSLWLNVIHKDMETPFFANRLTVGNAVIGAWLKVYSRDEVHGLKAAGGRGRLLPNKWWERAPHAVKFFSTRVARSVNEVYHFLLPDAGMLAVRGIREQKRAPENREADTLMAQKLKDWTAPVSESDFQKLQRLSAKIDVLLRQHYEGQVEIDRRTNNRRDLWDGTEGDVASVFRAAEQSESYADKQRLFDTRYGRDSAYRKLRLAMDYWCALWFWEYRDAALLPSRLEYWADIEALLDVDDALLDSRTLAALQRAGSSPDGGEEGDAPRGRISEDASAAIAGAQEELLTAQRGQRSLFDGADPPRLQIAGRLARRYRFFHPMLDFVEVFWQRGGFDIVCGNPPWIKLEFDEAAVVAERYPEVAIRKVSAPAVRQMLADFLRHPALRALYQAEQTEQACSSAFLNARANYPLLAGQKTNLYKCVLENCMSLASEERGYIGLLCPEGIYDDPKGQPLRRELYKRLRYHFQYQNEMRLFAEVDHHTMYGDQLLGPRRSSSIRFQSIHNLFHPSTVDACFAHDGSGACGGIKDEQGKWNTRGHRDRIVTITERETALLSSTFEDGATADCAKLVSIHCGEIVRVLEKIAQYPTHVRDKEPIITVAIDQTHGVDDGIMRRETAVPDAEGYGTIYSGPHFHVANPLYKTPRRQCLLNSDYDVVALTEAGEDYVPRTNYQPALPPAEYRKLFRGFACGQNTEGETVYEDWLDYYKVGFRRMINLTSERSLICAVLRSKTAHIHTVISASFRSGYDCVDMAALCCSLPLDFYMKTVGATDLFPSRMNAFPMGVPKSYQAALYARTLLLNCVTSHYASLWESCWRGEYAAETWSRDDARLKPFSTLGPRWTGDTPLRNYFERRQALVETDVLAAMALGLSLGDLETVYAIQFPVLQQNEADTWYDARGNIVFTRSSGLKGVGLERRATGRTGPKGWEDIRGEQLDENTYAGLAPTHTHTVDPQKSELYGGQEVTFYAPYTRCDRVADYRRAWAHFEERLGKHGGEE